MPHIFEIYIAEVNKSPVSMQSVKAVAHKGLIGDRYYNNEGTFSTKLADAPKSEITFISAEQVDVFNAVTKQQISYGRLRRNIITQNITLDTLIGKTFSIGKAKFIGVERCEPCSHLAASVNNLVLPHLVNTGLRAGILVTGTISINDEIVVLDE